MGDMSFLQDIWEAAKVPSPFIAMFSLFMWWRSENRSERLQSRMDTYLERTLNTINEVKDAIRENSKAILTAVRKD